MNKEFVSYEQSLALKELGFDEPCFTHYLNKILLNNLIIKDTINSRFDNIRCSAPLKQQAFRWFRDKHNLYSEILLDRTTHPKYCFDIHQYEDFGNYEKIKNPEWFLYRTYEEAEDACINKLIEIVKNKTQ